MSIMGVGRVGYTAAARRHFQDGGRLLNGGRLANAGQLFGLAAECGVKAILVACGAPVDAEGSVGKPAGASGKGFREHMPELHQAAIAFGNLLPDGRFTTRYMAMMPSLSAFNDWAVDQRYWGDAACPAASIPGWHSAADEVLHAIDNAEQDGVL
jgi:hypothetical protein